MTQNAQDQTEVIYPSTEQLIKSSPITPADVENTLKRAEALIQKTIPSGQ